MSHLEALYEYRYLLWMWMQRELRVRYKQAVLGAAWAVLQPVALMAVFTLVFSVLGRFPTDGIPYPIFVYAALLPWTFLQTSINFGVPSVVTNMNLVTKIHFPREILPLATIGAAFFDLLVASSVFLGMMVLYQVPLTISLLWLPLLLSIQTALTVGIVLALAALNVFYRDIRFVMPLATQLWMYATPIIYPLNIVPERLRPVYALNPMVGLIDGYRSVLLAGSPPEFGPLGISAVAAVIAVAVGYGYFKRAEKTFADLI